MVTLEEARAQLRTLRPLLDEIVALRADAAELGAAVTRGPATPLGRLPEFKAAQARLDFLLANVQSHGIELKGLGPLLLDWPAVLDGQDVLLCWLEGETDVDWYHRADLGFLGRRRLP